MLRRPPALLVILGLSLWVLAFGVSLWRFLLLFVCYSDDPDVPASPECASTEPTLEVVLIALVVGGLLCIGAGVTLALRPHPPAHLISAGAVALTLGIFPALLADPAPQPWRFAALAGSAAGLALIGVATVQSLLRLRALGPRPAP